MIRKDYSDEEVGVGGLIRKDYSDEEVGMG